MAFLDLVTRNFKAADVSSPVAKIEPPRLVIPAFATKDGVTEPYIGSGGFGGLGFPTTGSGVTVNAITALESAAVVSCINIIVTDIAKLPIRFERRSSDGGWTDDTAHPIAGLLQKPNRRMVQFLFMQNLILQYLLTGNGLAVVVRAANGQAEALVPVYGPASICENPVDGSKTYYVTSNLLNQERTSIAGQSGPTRTITEDDMVHLMGLSFTNGINGQSLFSLAPEVFGLTLAAQETAARTFNNGATTQGYFTTTTPMNQEAAQNWHDAWKRMTAGVANSGTTPFVGGGLEFRALGLTPEASQLLETRKFMIEEIARMYRIPPHKLGLLDGAKYNNIEQQNQSYIDETLSNITVPLEQIMNDVLLLTSEKALYRIRFDYSDMKQSDTQTRWNTYQTGLNNGFITPAWVARKEGLPIPTGDAATEYRRPLNTGTSGDQNGMPLADGDAGKGNE